MKLFPIAVQYIGDTSHPARGAWIEIGTASAAAQPRAVAPRKGCVD